MLLTKIAPFLLLQVYLHLSNDILCVIAIILSNPVLFEFDTFILKQLIVPNKNCIYFTIGKFKCILAYHWSCVLYDVIFYRAVYASREAGPCLILVDFVSWNCAHVIDAAKQSKDEQNYFLPNSNFLFKNTQTDRFILDIN